jgi:hypothetical protein
MIATTEERLAEIDAQVSDSGHRYNSLTGRFDATSGSEAYNNLSHDWQSFLGTLTDVSEDELKDYMKWRKQLNEGMAMQDDADAMMDAMEQEDERTPFHGSYDIHSPRWGHADRYELSMTYDAMRISQGTNAATCKLVDGDLQWSGYKGSGTRNPLLNIFHNDHIYPPTIVVSALEGAWEKWREDVDEDELRDGLQELFAWIDTTAKGKPSGGLWAGAF